MNRLTFAVVAGIAFGAHTVALMMPMSFPDKRAALIGAFVNRFGIGFLTPLVSSLGPGWLRGIIVGLLLSLPDAIITKAYAPILIIGCVGGTIIGWLSDKWAL
jgi:hypothetical protein